MRAEEREGISGFKGEMAEPHGGNSRTQAQAGTSHVCRPLHPPKLTRMPGGVTPFSSISRTSR